MSAPNIFVPMQTIASAQVNANFAMTLFSGQICGYAGNSAPTGWLLCNGAAISRTTYSDLFAAIGTKFGVGDGSTTFNIPNAQGRVLVGKDGTTEFLDLGTIGGEKTHQLTIAEMASHYHTVDPPATISSGATANHVHNENPSVYANAAGSDYWPHSGSSYWMNTESSGRSGLSTGYMSADHSHWVDIAAFNSANTGTDTSHNNLQPYLTINYLIKI